MINYSYISPEQVPVQFGGLRQDSDSDFSTDDIVTEVNMKPSSKQIIEITVTEVGIPVPLANDQIVLISD